ncbi:hypothetical protein ACJMK2_011398 [Sinanodonta woodiana]|uniref:Phospholipase A2-like central domain-containing protein n=1 Tax=Sinanodonta woodiana TaxID=1069815 RepID=A0ABD3V4W3_SINWO
MSPRLVTGLLFAAVLISMKCVECRIWTLDDGTSKSQKIMSVHGRYLNSIWNNLKDIKKILSGIYPGTNWCGFGNVANNNTLYGTSEETDKCCQAHDGCEIFITARDTKYGLKNKALYTVSSCECDQTFLDCMVGVAKSDTVPLEDKQTAHDFGRIFFNIINPKCLVKDYPIVCDEKGWFGKCSKSHKDTSMPKVWQFQKGQNFPSL